MTHYIFHLVFALSFTAVLVEGQYTLSNYQVSASARVESTVAVLEEHDDKQQPMYKNLTSTIEQLARDQKEIGQNLKQIDQKLTRSLKEQNERLEVIYHNLSSKFEISSRSFENRNTCYKIEQQQLYLESIKSSLSAKFEEIKTFNEDLQTRFDLQHKTSNSIHQNISAQIDDKMDQLLDIMQQTLQRMTSKEFERRFEEHDQTVRSTCQNVSIKIDKMQDSLREFDDKLNHILKITQRTQSNTSMENLERRLEVHDQSVSLVYKNISAQIDDKLNQNGIFIQQTMSNISINDDAKFKTLQAANDKIIDQVMERDRRLLMMQGHFSSAIEKLADKLNANLDHVNESFNFSDYCGCSQEVCDCSTIKANGYTDSGVYRIYVVNEKKRYYANAYCDMTTSNGAWTIFQRRKDGSVDFYRGWNDYANGFGDPNGEYWLGNDFIHRLTSKRTYRLRIDLEDFDDNRRYAEYSTVHISSSMESYRLRIGTYSGNAGNSLNYHNGRQFTTKDADNDLKSSGNCAVDHHGAWWYNTCHQSNLNGIYKRGSYSFSDCNNCGIVWYNWRRFLYSLKTTEMKVSPDA